MTEPSVQYDAAVIEEMARRLLARADSIVALYTLFGILIGILPVSGVLVEFLAGSPIAWVALVLLTVIGYAIGSSRAFAVRLQAQLLLCQVSIERNTARLLHLHGTVGR